MKTTVFKDSIMGAMIGGLLAITYMVIVLIIAELSLPLANPSEIIFFTNKSLPSTIGSLLTTSPVWLLAPILIGYITTIFINFTLTSFHFSRNGFLSICLVFCLVITLFIYLPFKELVLFQLGFSDVGFGGSKYFMLFSPLVGFILIILPGLIYLAAGLIIGNARYNQFNSS